MLDSLFNLFFGCRHRRTSFPWSPSVKPGAHEDMYVVCLDCGKRFHYQWDLMRIGEEMEGTDEKPAVRKRPLLRYAAMASALPILWLIGKVASLGRKRKIETGAKN